MKYKSISLSIFLLFFSLTFVTYLLPNSVACILSPQIDYSDQEKELINNAQNRITQKFGSLGSTPKIVFSEKTKFLGVFETAGYGITNFTGSYSCIIIGPEGRNTDVVSHEIMHAEIMYRIGWFKRFTDFPAWFEEGLAMQVDYREKYIIKEEVDTSYIKGIVNKKFYSGETDEVIKNYSSAKKEVSVWVSEVGESNVYEKLETLKSGSSFNHIFE